MICIKPACGGPIIPSPFAHRNAHRCKLCGTVYTVKGKVRMTGTDWTPPAKDCTPAFARGRGIK